MEIWKKNITFFSSLQTRLILAFLAVSIIPLVIVGWLTFVQSQNALSEQVSNQLVSVRDLKAEQIEAFFQLVEDDIILVSEFPVVVEAIQDFVLTDDFYAVRRSGYLGNPDLIDSGSGAPYDIAHARYHELFKEVVETMGYDDLYLVAPDGTVVYNYDKGDDFGTNLLTGPYRNTSIAELFQSLYTSTNSNEIEFSDFPHYGPSKRVPASFVGTPIVVNAQNVGVLIYQLPLDRINELVQGKTSFMGETGEVYLVGPEKLMRTDSRFSPESTIFEQEVDTLSVLKALAGEIGVTQVVDYRGVSTLSAYRPIRFGNQTWALIAEIDTAEAFAATRSLRNSVIGLTGVAVLIVVVVGYFTARNITHPVSNLTKAATAIAEGDLSHRVAIETRDEIGLLAQAFDTMARRLQRLFETLEDRVRERTHALETSKEAAEVATQALEVVNTQLNQEIKERKRTEAKLQKLAITDSLTQIYNRRYFFELAEQEFIRTQRYQHGLAVIMLDLDLFKKINDQYGHRVGDYVLQTVASWLHECVRENDILGRYGGEEFVILLPETSLPDGREMAERLCQTISAKQILTEEHTFSITTSIGIASLDKDDITIDILIDRADQALYAAKEAGRNCVKVWERK